MNLQKLHCYATTKSEKKIFEPPKFSGYKPYGSQEQAGGYIELL